MSCKIAANRKYRALLLRFLVLSGSLCAVSAVSAQKLFIIFSCFDGFLETVSLRFCTSQVYPTGNMSRHIDNLKVGESLEIKGPIPKIPIKENMKKSIGLVSQSGLTS